MSDSLWSPKRPIIGKVNLLNSTIIIPYRGSRIRNKILYRILDNFIVNFNTNIFIAEHDVKTTISLNKSRWKNIRYKFIKAKPNQLFDRTGTLNYLIKNSNTDVIFNHDADIIIHPLAYEYAEKLLLRGKFDFIMPHNGAGWNVKHTFSYPNDVFLMNKHCFAHPNDIILKDISRNFKNIKHIKKFLARNKNMIDLKWNSARGGVVAIRKDKYIEAGMENQNIVSWGFEDFERFHRFETLGYRIYGGYLKNNEVFKWFPMYHYDHDSERGSNSTKNPFRQSNKDIAKKIKSMDKKSLLKEIETWEWTK